MDITEVSVIHHVGIVLALLWFLSSFNWCHPIAYFVSLIYLYQVNEQYITRMRRKLQFDERKQANQKRVLSDSETVRWLNYAVDKIWSICMEEIVSQKILLPIIPWFLEKYKPWTAKEAVVQHLYMGRNPPVFTDMRVVRQFNNDDHLVLELGMNFLTADDMLAILSVKLRKRLGFGMRPKLHITGMHIEGKVLVGVKFLRRWPFLGRLRVCFAEPPYFQMTVKPIFTHGLDVTELPGIAGWLDKLLSVAFEQTLVEPNMLVVDMEKFASPQPESWFSMDVKEPIAYAKVEVVEASNMKPSDLNGLADPYVKGHLGPYRFRTKTQKKTLAPKWNEEFKIPICQWDSPNLLAIEVRDKDHFVDDTLGDCTININDLRDGQRHDMWLPLQNVKVGRLHLAITVLEDNVKGDDHPLDGETLNKEDLRNSFASETAHEGSFSYVSSEKSQKVADSFEPINIEGQRETGIWVHHPGSDVSQIWEPRKGKNRCLDTKIQSEANDSIGSFNSLASGSYQNDSSSADENPEGKKPTNAVWRGLKKIGTTFHRSPKKDEQSSSIGEAAVPSPHANLRPVNARNIGVKFVIEEVLTEKKENDLSGPHVKFQNAEGSSKEVLTEKKENDLSGPHVKIQNAEGSSSAEGSGQDSPSKGNMKGMAKSILKHAGNSARGIKHALSRKSSRRCRGDSGLVQPERELLVQSDPSDDESLPFAVHSPEVERILIGSNDLNSKVDNSWTVSSESVMNTEDPVKNEKLDSPERIADEKAGNYEGHDDELVEESSNPKLSVGNLEEEREGEGQRGRNLA